jgi:N utilization substance protein A
MDLSIIENLSAIAKTKSLDKTVVLSTLKESLVIAAKKYLDIQKNMEAEIDEDTNQIQVFLRVTVAEDYPDVDEDMTEEEVRLLDEKYMLLHEAHEYNEAAEVGDYLEMEVPIENFGRSAITTAKQMLLQKITNAERDQVYDEFKSKEGELVSGTVQQIDRGTIFVNLGKTEAVLPAKEQIRKERYRQGESILTYIASVSNETRGHQILLSRAHPHFLARLVEREVPEISDGIVIIRSVSRDPGYRAKISVSTRDDRIDPVGACVGMKGNRVQAIVRELSNERIDIIHWSEDITTYIRRALSPADIRQINDIGDGRVVVIVGDEDLSQAIGRGGQNVRLASKLIGKELDIYGATEFENMTMEEKSRLFEKREEVVVQSEELPLFEVKAQNSDKLSGLESLFKNDN